MAIFAAKSLAGPAESALYRRLLAATLLLAAAAFYWGLGDIALMSFNEARRAIPEHDMFMSGDWLLPRLNGELYLTKPPLLYWLAAGAARLVGGVDEWAVRLPSALAATATLVFVYRYALRVFGAWPALFSVQILIANAGFAMFARRAEIEMLLTALCSAALLAALNYTHGNGGRGWLRLSYFLLGLAVLTKGPLALLFVTLPLLADALYRRQPRQWDALRDPLGWCIFWTVGLSWYVAVTWQLGFDTWLSIIQRDMVNKVQAAAGEPVYSYLLWMLTDFLPAGLLILAAPLAVWRRWKVHPVCTALLLAVAVPFLVYSLFGDKHAKYLLPVYPILALLLGKRLAELLEQAGPSLRRLLLALGILLPALYASYFVFAEARIYAYRSAAFPQFSAWLRTAPNVPLYGYRELDERLIYYAQRRIPMLDAAALQKSRESQASMLLLVENKYIAEAKPHAGCVVKEFTPYLKKGKTLAVLGFGAACPVGQDDSPGSRS